jgi:hypothetical protein
MSETYRTLDATICLIRPKAILVESDNHKAWIPRSCIHGGDERRLDALDPGDEVELRVFEWLVEKEWG